MSWTDERVELLTKLWSEGKSASEIAAELGEVTRNAVIGKINRMGLKKAAQAEESPAKAEKLEEKPVEKPKATKAKTKPKPVEDKVEEEKAPIETKPNTPVIYDANQPHPPQINPNEISPEAREEAARVEKTAKKLDLMQLTERTCKWPIGDPATEEFWFCGHPSQPGKPYCQAHIELAFQAPVSRK